MTPQPPKPGRAVPTLTEVVQLPARPPGGEPAPAPWGTPAPDRGVLGEALVHRVMQRVELSMERQLREAVSRVVAEQVHQMGPLLRTAVERAVRDAVEQALAQELPSRPPPA